MNTVIKHNYTYAGTNMPRPSVNAFGLNHGVRNFILDSNYLTCQTRLGFNNTPIFDASVKGNKIMAGIPAVYGYYLWGFTQTDFPLNDYFPEKPKQGPEYFIIPNGFDPNRSHLVIYNWDSASTVNVDVSAANVSEGETFYLVNVLDCFSDTIKVVCPANKRIDVPMTGMSFIYPNASTQIPATPFPEFGVFILIKKSQKFVKNFEFIPESSEIRVIPNPSSGKIEINKLQNALALVLENNSGVPILSYSNIAEQLTIDLSPYPKGMYLLRIIYKHKTINKWVLLL
ncbi:MAG: T9SS type A sorting domain-containing protein [Saprospiraceae bacterium]|nr:T9SS type A sorting domain-containing protein [Saprospiraceae bacterium]